MAQNKNALIRYKTIDKCLQNAYRQWTLEDLIEACSHALNEYEGKDVNVSKRTVQLDIQLMRSDKLGYNAPIEVYDKKYYRYADEGYSITDIPLTENDMNVLTETMDMLRQFKDFSLFSELSDIIQRLEDKIYTEKTKRPSVIHLDKNESLKGLHHLEGLYQSIVKEIVLAINYQSFRARRPSEFLFHPYLLKEFNNRWFLIGKREGHQNMLTLALDRIVSFDWDLDTVYQKVDFDPDQYYENTIGVTVMPNYSLRDIHLKIDRTNAPYVLTKPLHHSQQFIHREKDGSILITLRVQINYEFERLLLGFGPSLEVIKPAKLRKRMHELMRIAVSRYSGK